MAVRDTERNRERLGDPLGELTGNIALLEGRIVAGLEGGDRRDRKLVVDAGIIDPEGGRKKAVANDFVGSAFTNWNERNREPRQAPRARSA